MSDAQMDSFKETFKLFDTDKSGTITKGEWLGVVEGGRGMWVAGVGERREEGARVVCSRHIRMFFM